MKNCTYIYERTYPVVQNFQIHPDVIDYWEKILSKEVCQKINKKENDLINYILSDEELYSTEFKLEDTYIWDCYMNQKDRYFVLQNDLENSESLYVFYEFYYPFLQIAEKMLLDKNVLNNIFTSNPKTILDDFETKLASKLLDCCVRMLVFEMNLCKMNGELNGENPEEEYNDYTKRWLRNKSYTDELFETYPALARLIIDIINNTVDYYTEILENYLKDEKEIIQLFNIKNPKILKIRVGGSDSHNHGKSVARIIYDNGQEIIYKPHSISTEYEYQKFLQWIGKQSGIGMKSYAMIDKGNYGWEELVIHTPCKSENELKDYYKRIGVVLCVNYMLNVYDIHHENIIAYGPYPIVIDAETILKNNEPYDSSKIKEYSLNKIRETVVAQGLLPQHIRKGGAESLDLSGLSHEEGVYPVKIPVFINARRSDMKCVYKNPKSPVQNNFPMLADKPISYSNYLDYILKGFHIIYEYVIKNKEKTLEKFKAFKKLTLRHLRRDTQTYAMILETSRHPDFLIDAASRELLLMSLYKNKNMDDNREYQAVKDEVRQLLSNDIPMFTYNAASTYLISEYGLMIENYFEKSAYDITAEKISNMTYDDMKQQELYIVLAIASTDQTVTSNYHINRKKIDYILDEKVNTTEPQINMNFLQNKCIQIIEKIKNNAIYTPNKTKVNWIGISMGGIDEIRWNVVPLSYTLYDGVGGIAVFLHAYSKTFKDETYKSLCECVDATLEEHLNDILLMNNEFGVDFNSGGFTGECSLMYVFLTLYEVTSNENYLENAKKLYKIVEAQTQADIKDEVENDIIAGTAGTILTLLKMYDICRDEQYLKLAIKAGYVLVKNGEKEGERIGWTLPGQPYSVSGLSHGFSGIALSLFKLAKVSGIQFFHDIGVEAILEENSMYKKQFGNWADRRVFKGKSGEEIGNNPVTWCHGAAGILLARIKMYPFINNKFRPIIEEDIQLAAETLNRQGGLKNQCLCHGQMGNLEIMDEYGLFKKDDVIQAKANAIYQVILQSTENSWDCGLAEGYEHFGFMTGISGIGYSLLRKINNDLPCILALD
ncbi:type 2 lanthipeptide synthetase LanM family protein [Anaerocolumna aminovalerica]|jgi:type 2 lantibiotic biosynthesis protein LanM|uniref:type 2 lanthipeptide synthetase LanM family protein n=1 Tax=Anaerocolumna aminovalerica TaxID=1527 RepID=UPI001C0EC2E3|nr:type 2 lanthipeptide synthetase LanM family protein [Anaerocolumna aminovalerica]MBU5334611.1 type 2 lantipeptide synthetase LanM family protein [Anaerocolumna aminovalerica]